MDNEINNNKIFIKDIYIENDSIFVEYSDGNIIKENYSVDNYNQLLEQKEDSLKNFDINGLNNDIFENKIRRILILILGISGFIILKFNIVILLLMTISFLANEAVSKEDKKAKKQFEKSKYLNKYNDLFNCKVEDNNNIKNYVEEMNDKAKTTSIENWNLEQLKELRNKILEESNLNEQNKKIKPFTKLKK